MLRSARSDSQREQTMSSRLNAALFFFNYDSSYFTRPEHKHRTAWVHIHRHRMYTCIDIVTPNTGQLHHVSQDESASKSCMLEVNLDAAIQRPMSRLDGTVRLVQG